mgnify:CR=1 FL=1
MSTGPQTIPAYSRLTVRDVVRVGTLGLVGRKLRAALSVVGIAIGIAALVAVLGISQSSRADLLAQLDSLGTNLLTASPGQSFMGEDAALPEGAALRVGRIGPVDSVASLASLDATVRRSELVDESETGGIAVSAAAPGLLTTLEGSMAAGEFLNEATATLPNVVLGAVAAERLAVDRVGVQVDISGTRYTVAGIMRPLPLAADLDRSALVGIPQAASDLLVGETPEVTRIYARVDPDQVAGVREVIGATADPSNPEQVDVSRPSDVLEARTAADSALTALFLGLGALALLVGGIGIANVMVISVLERRSEIGLRRALGATRRHIGMQFLSESLILSALGGIGGIIIGVGVTPGYAAAQGWQISVPAIAVVGGLGAALLIGAGAGMYPALRAARLAPTEALRSN